MFKPANSTTSINLIAAVFLGIGFITSCKPVEKSSLTATADNGLINIAVANYPLAYFAGRIGGTEVNVIYQIPEEVDPAFWEPSEKDIADFQGADLILMNGAGYSKWADKVSLPVSRVVDTSAAFSDKFIKTSDTATHSHGKQAEHSHDGIAFTTWIDFDQALQQAGMITQALQKLRPEQVELFALNYDLLKQDLMSLDREMKMVGQKLAGQAIATSHPVYQYWARRYQIDQKSVLWEPDAVPTDEQVADLKKLLMNHPSRWFVWEGTPAGESVAKLKALGANSVVFDPCGNKPEHGNWLTVMQDNLANMKKLAGVE